MTTKDITKNLVFPPHKIVRGKVLGVIIPDLTHSINPEDMTGIMK